MKHQMEAVCYSHKGKKRGSNEDNFYFDGAIREIDDEIVQCSFTDQKDLMERNLFAVFDGMGGEADGEEASYLAAGQLHRDVCSFKNGTEQPESFLKMMVQHMNKAVCDRAKVLFSSMGTTVVILYLADGENYICNVGDSRAYCLHEGKLSQISVDHTDAVFLAEMKIKNRKPRLSQYIGIPEEELQIEPYLTKIQYFPNDQYLLCSDGLTDMVSLEEITEIMQEKLTVAECAEKLMQKALECGGKDNITFVLIRIREVDFERN